MKTPNLAFLSLLCVSLAVTSCTGLPPGKSETVRLEDAIIAAAKSAKAAGASKLTYEATITTNKETQATVVVPVGPLAPSLGGKITSAVGSKITVEVPIQTAAAATPSGQKFEINNQTLEFHAIQ